MLKIDGRLPSCNEYTFACRSNAYAGASMKKKAQKKIADAIHQQIPNEHYEGAVTLKFRWYEKNKRRDLDGVCFGKKFILDSLQECGVLNQDNWKAVVGFTDEFFIDKDNPRIEVDIIPVIPFNDFVPNPFDEVKLCEK